MRTLIDYLAGIWATLKMAFEDEETDFEQP